MNNNLSEVFQNANLLNRYKEICEIFNDFPNRMKDVSMKDIISIFNEIGLGDFNKTGGFFSLVCSFSNIESVLNITTKGGLVEPFLYIKIDGITQTPNGRLDFISEELDGSFDRTKYNLAKYTSLQELKVIMISLLSIYWNVNYKLIKSLPSGS